MAVRGTDRIRRRRGRYADKASGATFERPQHERLKGAIAAGDVIVVKSIDRLGLNYAEILDEWRFCLNLRTFVLDIAHQL